MLPCFSFVVGFAHVSLAAVADAWNQGEPGCRQAESDNGLELRRGLQVCCQVFVVDLHPVKEPLGIALQNGCDLLADVAAGLAKSVDNAAQMGFVNAQHSCQAILPNPARVDSQFEVRINFSAEAHCLLTLCIAEDLWLLMGDPTATT